MHKDEQQPEQRHGSLLTLYDQTWEEIRRLREFEWKIAVTFITLSGGFVALICSDSFKPLLTYNLRWILTAAQIFAIIFGIYCLLRTHYYLAQQRDIRRKIEDVLNFHEPAVFMTEALLPGGWKSRQVRFSFQLELLIPLMLIVFLVQALAIYVTWFATAKPAIHIQDRERCLSRSHQTLLY